MVKRLLWRTKQLKTGWLAPFLSPWSPLPHFCSVCSHASCCALELKAFKGLRLQSALYTLGHTQLLKHLPPHVLLLRNTQ